jgi:hypothetical protein
MVENGAADVLAYLPPCSVYKYKRLRQLGPSLQLHIGQHTRKPLYVTPENTTFCTDSKMRRIHVGQYEKWDIGFLPLGLLGWGDIKKGLREPMDSHVLALVQYICITKAVEQEMDVQLPTPKLNDLLAGLEALRDSGT